MKKREDYLTWDEYFMGIALLSAKRSKDPSTQVGACIVNKHKKVVVPPKIAAFEPVYKSSAEKPAGEGK